MELAPVGTVTLFYTDIEGSTSLWERFPIAMRTALARHDQIIRMAIATEGGHIFKAAGDAFGAAFATATGALAAADAMQRALHDEPWGETGPIRVRVALHTGALDLDDGQYVGTPLNRVERLLRAASGGQVLVSLTTHELIRDALPDGRALRDLGEHRLPDLTRSESIFQLVIPGLPSDFPPLRTLDRRPNNLPVQATTLIGRERDVAALLDMIRSPGRRLITVKGPGGIGKTRLALQVAAELVDEFADGVFFIPLASVDMPAEVPQRLSDCLGVPERMGASPVANLSNALRDKRVLLVLDTFEHLLPAGKVVADLLANSATLKIVVTSTSLLHLLGEHVYEVPPLDLPSLADLSNVKRLAHSSAVQLFVDRARSARADFCLAEENAPAVAEICARLDGLPLAIEFAASRMRLLTPKALLARLDNRFSLLSRGSRDGPPRHQTLRNAIAWSYDLLDPDEQALFRRLAVFVGGFSIDAALAVATAGGELALDVFDGLDSLVGKSLLRQDEVDGEPRLAMLETIREFGRERLNESGEAGVVAAAHAALTT